MIWDHAFDQQNKVAQCELEERVGKQSDIRKHRTTKKRDIRRRVGALIDGSEFAPCGQIERISSIEAAKFNTGKSALNSTLPHRK